MPEPKIDRMYFAANFPSSKLYGNALTNSRMQGFEAIFDFWDQVESFDSLEWLAYELATAWHETGARMLPVREGFAESDEVAYQRVTAYCAAQGRSNYAMRHQNGNSYYGRGYVQLTHAENYLKMGEAMGHGRAFYDKPDRVMDPSVGAEILVTGMMRGLFRPAKGSLLDYFNHQSLRWYDARDLINGDMSKKPAWANGKTIGSLVAGYGKAFFGVLKYA